MSDITYCMNRHCPFKNCEKHSDNLSKFAGDETIYVSIADFGGTCRRYIAHLIDEIND